MGDLRDIVDKKFTLPAPGKLNLCLNILGRRPDGYHELQTAFQIISIADSISFELSGFKQQSCKNQPQAPAITRRTLNDVFQEGNGIIRPVQIL